MHKEILTSDNILSILVGRGVMLPWRCQSDLQIVVPFNEYRKFVTSMVSSGVTYLDCDVATYEKALTLPTDKLLHRLFVRDLSGSIYNEISLSYSYGKDATLITAGYDSEKALTLSESIQWLAKAFSRDEIQTARMRLKNQYIHCSVDDSRLTEWNLGVLFYGVMLRAMSVADKERFNIGGE